MLCQSGSRHITTSTTTDCKLREIFAAQHGLPEILVSDNAPNFTSEEFETVMRKNGIVHITSAPYHPASIGLAERAVKTVKSGITKSAGDNVETRSYRDSCEPFRRQQESRRWKC